MVVKIRKITIMLDMFSVSTSIVYIKNCTYFTIYDNKKNLMFRLERYEIRTLVVDTRYEQTAFEQWWWWKSRYANLVERQEYIDVITNAIELIILPLYEKLNYHAMCDVRVMFEHLFQVGKRFSHFRPLRFLSDLFFNFIHSFLGSQGTPALRLPYELR